MSLMDPRHIAVWLENEQGLDLALAKSNQYIMGISCRIFRWRLGFSTIYDPVLVHVWVELHHLAYECIAPSILKGIGDDIGHFLAMDKANFNRSHTCIARICVELDTNYELPQKNLSREMTQKYHLIGSLLSI